MDFNQFCQDTSRQITSFASDLEPTQWAILALVVVVFGCMLLKGNMLKGA